MLHYSGPAELALSQATTSPVTLPDPLPTTAGELILDVAALAPTPTVARSDTARAVIPGLWTFAENSCRARELPVPTWLGAPPRSLRQLDRQLDRSGLRLLVARPVASVSREIAYVPVTTADWEGLAGRVIAGVRLDDFETGWATATGWSGVTTTAVGDSPLIGAWTDLGRLLGLSSVGLGALATAVADLDAFIDVHMDAMEDAFWGLEPEEVTLSLVLTYLLAREDSAVGFDRKSEVTDTAAMLSETAPSRRAGAVGVAVNTDPDAGFRVGFEVGDNLLALQRAFEPFGVGVVALHEEFGSLATYPSVHRDALLDAERRTGQSVLHEW